MIYRVVWESAMILHFLVLAYLTVGGFAAWRWPKLIWPHLAIAAWGVVQVFNLIECPLTALENWGRARAGQHGLAPGGFIDTYVEGVIYPERYTGLVRVLVLALVIISWLGFWRISSARRRPGSIAGTRPGSGAAEQRSGRTTRRP